MILLYNQQQHMTPYHFHYQRQLPPQLIHRDSFQLLILLRDLNLLFLTQYLTIDEWVQLLLLLHWRHLLFQYFLRLYQLRLLYTCLYGDGCFQRLLMTMGLVYETCTKLQQRMMMLLLLLEGLAATSSQVQLLRHAQERPLLCLSRHDTTLRWDS
jgi:hypothetical protein